MFNSDLKQLYQYGKLFFFILKYWKTISKKGKNRYLNNDDITHILKHI
jgi:hypothetical protein